MVNYFEDTISKAAGQYITTNNTDNIPSIDINKIYVQMNSETLSTYYSISCINKK